MNFSGLSILSRVKRGTDFFSGVSVTFFSDREFSAGSNWVCRLLFTFKLTPNANIRDVWTSDQIRAYSWLRYLIPEKFSIFPLLFCSKGTPQFHTPLTSTHQFYTKGLLPFNPQNLSVLHNELLSSTPKKPSVPPSSVSHPKLLSFTPPPQFHIKTPSVPH